MQISEMTRDEVLAQLEADPNAFFTAFFEELGIKENQIPDEFYQSGRNVDYFTNEHINGLTLNMVATKGGYEGGGDHASKTYALIDRTEPSKELAHIKIDGHYNSYDGTEWDDHVYVVYPRQVVVTQYHTTKG